jgi:formyltetrahydrofolate-dependent phosphoribosylglycinamide formyltransferase
MGATTIAFCGTFATMFSRLKQKWRVNNWQLLLILCTFAMGGSICGFFTREIITPLAIENHFLYGTVYFVLLSLLWPVCVLLVSIPLGQFTFFNNYLRKLGSRFGLGKANAEQSHPKVRLAIFASGSGSNAARIMEYFKNHYRVEVALLVCNKPGAGALHHAANYGVSTLLIHKEQFFQGNGYNDELLASGIDFIALAGFLWKIPPSLIAAFPHRIVNIHPALLPKYGGKGMYGARVHQAVLDAGDTESGITIHYVDELYDHGASIFQAKCPVLPGDTPGILAQRIHALEHAHFAPQLEKLLLSINSRPA